MIVSNNSMDKRFEISFILLLVLIIGMVAVVPYITIFKSNDPGVVTIAPQEYVSSKYSKYCYIKGDVNRNIKVKLYYKTLAKCGKPLYNL